MFGMFEMLDEDDRNLIFSGQLFFRKSGEAVSLDMTNRELFAVSGIIAVPNNCGIKGEHQYALAGTDSKTHGIILKLDKNGKDITEKARGNSVGGLLLEPIWRI